MLKESPELRSRWKRRTMRAAVGAKEAPNSKHVRAPIFERIAADGDKRRIVVNMPVNVTGPGFDCADPDVVRSRSRSAVHWRRRHHPIRLLVLLTLVSLSFVPGASAQAINRIFFFGFFGDSLSDPPTTSFLPISV